MCRLASILLFFNISQSVALAECHYINYSDPDEFFDNIGRTDFCQYQDKNASADQKSPSTREDLGGGMTSSNAGSGSEGGRGVVVANEGIVYVAGRTGGASSDFLLLKYFPDGTLDSSFNSDGKATYSFGDNDDWAHSIMIDTNGKIVVAGRTDVAGSNSSFDFALLRINSLGNLDTTFSTDGLIKVDLSGRADIARAVTVQTDGKLVVSGYVLVTDWDFGFLRVHTDGSLDTSFSTVGFTVVSNGSNDDGSFAVAVDINEFIIGAGSSYNGANFDFAAARLTPSGNLDTSFATSGKITTPINAGADSVYSVAVEGTKVYMGGATYNGANLDFGFVKLTSSGSLDTSFSTSGKATIAVLSNDDTAYGIQLQTGGAVILAAGYAYNGSNNDFAVVRLRTNGTLDTSFSTSGIFTKAVKSAEDTAQSIAMRGHGTIMVAGRTDTGGGSYDIAVMRLQSDGTLAASGQRVKSFGTNGQKIMDFSGTDYGRGITLDTLGRILAFGAVNADFAIARLHITGDLDTSFNTNGRSVINQGGTDTARNVTVQTDGKIVLCGEGNTLYTVMRLLSNGTLDTTFATDGSKSHTAGICVFVAQTPDQKLVTFGDTGADSQFVKFMTDGNLDTAFATDGNIVFAGGSTEDPFGGHLFANGTVIGVGEDSGTASKSYTGRVTSDGRLDTTYSTDGIQAVEYTGGDDTTDHGNPFALYKDNSSMVWIAGQNDGAFEQAPIRIRSNGSLDTAFNTTGARITALSGICSGTVVTGLGKNTHACSIPSDYGFSRYTTDGRFDTTFGTNGYIVHDMTVGPLDYSSGLVVTEEGWLCTNGRPNNQVDFGVLCVWQ